jgi:hypothetical protein
MIILCNENFGFKGQYDTLHKPICENRYTELS